MTGSVILVGAGPGDPGLITVKGLEALETAQVVVYDRLVGPALLARIPVDAEHINVGKEAFHHPIPQEEINRILLDKALEGKRVVRLKGGDPFVFGRGGEELELLAQHGVPFSVVPGVTSAVAAPVCVGIPLTHRDYAASLHIVTGHRRAGQPLDIDFGALVRAGGTIVFLMGVSTLPELMDGLLCAGMPGDTPAAVVENGTTPLQRRVDGTVDTMAVRAAEAEVKSPAITVVGAVCALAERFEWFERGPLFGRGILVTRPRERAGTLTARLRALGARVWECPCIRTVPIVPSALPEDFSGYEWLVLTSPAGVVCLMDELERQGRDARALGGVKLAAIGPGTAAELKKYRLRANYLPELYDAAHLGAGLAERTAGRVLLFRAEEGSPGLTEALSAAGVSWDDVSAYRTEYGAERADELRALLRGGEIDTVTFTSASTVRGFLAAAGGGFDPARITGVCIGPVTAAEAERHGIRTVTAECATLDGLLAAVVTQAEIGFHP